MLLSLYRAQYAFIFQRWPVRLVEYIVEIALQCFTELSQDDNIQSAIVTSVSNLLENDDVSRATGWVAHKLFWSLIDKKEYFRSSSPEPSRPKSYTF